MPKSRIFNVANRPMSFKATRENKILAKISEFTVSELPSMRLIWAFSITKPLAIGQIKITHSFELCGARVSCK